MDDAEDCRSWLVDVWPSAGEAIGLASSALAARIEQILGGHPVPASVVRAVTGTVVRYLLRAGGRATPFGVFAGVAPARFGSQASVELGDRHRSTCKADAAWLDDIVDRLENGGLLPRLKVVFNSLVTERAGWLVVPHAETRAEIALSAPVRVVRDSARDPVAFTDLRAALTEAFPDVSANRVESMLRELVAQRLLLTCLRAPMIHADPLGHLVAALSECGASDLAETAWLLAELERIHTGIEALNELSEVKAQAEPRAAVVVSMDRINSQARSPVVVNLALDCEVCLPESVADDMAVAADVLARLGREPLGPEAWAAFHRRFVDHYGTDTVVPLAQVLDGPSGLGYPAGYPGSVLPQPDDTVTDRDRRLLALAWQALADGGRLELTDAMIEWVTEGDLFDERFIQPHLEIAARIQAASLDAVQAGDYRLAVSPARSAGTLSARFQQVTRDAMMVDAYRGAPVMHEGAVPVQLSCPPMFVRGQNVARLPPFLPTVLALGEPPMPQGESCVLRPEDLALTATGRGLLLVTLRDQRIVDPQVFHALALERQMPPLARFLAHVSRAYAAAFTHFDFGPAATALPHLPEVRYRRTVLAPERWKIRADELPDRGATMAIWHRELRQWRERYSCPSTMELADGDMTLRMNLDVSAHAAILREHLRDKNATATLNRAPAETDYGWIGHAHEIVAPIFRAGKPAPNKLGPAVLVRRSNTDGHRPADPDARWLSASLYTHPDAMDDIIAIHLPTLLAAVDDAPTWIVRYRNPEQTDHLRIRIRTGGSTPAAIATAFGAWSAELTNKGVAGRAGLDTYYPEIGRYGGGAAMDAAEAVFCTDTRAAIITLRRLPNGMHPDTLTALSMLDIAEAFCGGMHAAVDYLALRSFRNPQTIDRAAVAVATRLARHGVPRRLLQLPDDLAAAWSQRADALATYRATLPTSYDPATVLNSLLHLHFNRHRGIDRDHEGACTRLVRSAAFAWRAQAGSTQ
ncbi:MAG: lantibiotic dehydratase [Sciscionella sp.]